MKFVKTADKNLVAKVIAARLVRELSLKKKVLWLMPGGSNIEIAVEIMQKIPAEPSRNLTIGLTDERFGKIGHQDSNYEQYKIAGFDAKFAKFVPVLDGSRSFGDNVKNYEPIFREMLAQNDFCLGFFGMGPDGHAAGILPGSPVAAANANSRERFFSREKWSEETRNDGLDERSREVRSGGSAILSRKIFL